MLNIYQNHSKDPSKVKTITIYLLDAMSSFNLPTTIRTLLQPDYHSNHIILSTCSLPTPALVTDQHLLRVHAVAITNNELTWNANFPPPAKFVEKKLPVPCYDVAGTIITSPSNSPFQPGDEVWARSDYRYTGAASEYMTISTNDLALKPKILSWTEAASVPMSAETAWQALFVHGGLTPEAGVGGAGKMVFVTAASGAVGSWIVQLAKWCGAQIVGTCSFANVDYVRSLGAEEVLDYRATDVKVWAHEDGHKADLVIDCIGGCALRDAWWVVKEDGIVLSIFQPPEPERPESCTVNCTMNKMFVMEADGQQLAQVARLIQNGNFVPVLDSVWPLAQFELAFARSVSGKTRGKVVLDMGVVDI